MSNLWRREFKDQFQAVGLGWATCQVLRKTNASLSRKAGFDAKVSADQRGHGLGVSMEAYTMSDRQQKREAVSTLEAIRSESYQRELNGVNGVTVESEVLASW